MRKWKILLVDDEVDVHTITKLVFKQKRWRNRRFQIVSAHSQKEAMQVLDSDRDFHVAILDVVMEQNDSGLELCELIRKTCPTSMRIILRTGQPGLAPEEEILNEYDVDYYLAKADATPNKLYSIIRACIRSSQDISTLVAYGKQLQSFTKTLHSITAVSDLVVFMHEALCFLELKHDTQTWFNYDLSRAQDSFIIADLACDTAAESSPEERGNLDQAAAAMRLAHERGLAFLNAHPGPELGLQDGTFVIPFETQEQAHGDVKPPPVLGALVFEMQPEQNTAKSQRDFLNDAALFLDNWCIAFATLRLSERLAQEQLLRDQMYYERLESIATMVTGVAHELNTPLGVARTANSMVTELVQGILDTPPEDEGERRELEDDLMDACNLMNKNLERSQRLIQSFKQLSASQLTDDQVIADLDTLVQDCLQTMSSELKRRGITPTVHAEPEANLEWNGYPGHLSQVLLNLLQNAIRYAYPDGEGGTIDIHLIRADDDHMRIRFVDHGEGVAEDILPRLFDAFVTSGRSKGGIGLGLSIVHNIVTNLLGGTIRCESQLGEGTEFIIDLPAVVDVEETKHLSAYRHSPKTATRTQRIAVGDDAGATTVDE